MKLRLNIALETILLALIAVGVGFLLKNAPGVDITAEGEVLLFFFEAVGTLYALIAAFVMIHVWDSFHNLDEAVTAEAKSLVSLWDDVDYLSNPKTSKQMRVVLVDYLKAVIARESILMKKSFRIHLPSKEIRAVHTVLDNISNNNPKRKVVFQSILQEYKELTRARSRRIEANLVRVPSSLRLLFESISVLFLISVTLLHFESSILYLFVLTSCTVITLLAFITVMDLDNPFEGIWNVPLEPYNDALHVIQSTDFSETSK